MDAGGRATQGAVAEPGDHRFGVAFLLVTSLYVGLLPSALRAPTVNLIAPEAFYLGDK
jgi:hypothetical protein